MERMTYELLKKELVKYIKDEEELKVIDKAYNFANEKHLNKFRKNGDLYIEHPLNVAYILSGYNLDYKTISAALLHETINHGGATYDEILKEFDSDIANLVDSMSKINRLELPDDKLSSALHLRKVLVGITSDVRVLYIKLADRLHNMRTIYALTPNEIKVKINETENVLIPIAHRLGINKIKGELEDLCLKYSKPQIYDEIINMLNDSSETLNKELDEMKKSLTDLLNEHGIKFKIKGRVKSVHSIYEKMVNGHKFNQIYDVLALRIILEKVSDCYLALGLIHAKYKPMPNRFKDYIAMPKKNMYQSLHTTIYGIDNYIFEVQIRTFDMDEFAEKGFASHWSYKEHGDSKQNIMEQKLELFRNLIEQQNDLSDIDFENSINEEVLNKVIYCFTPKGDVVELPINATPVDFAYRIHSHVGDTTVGAKVNDKIVPLNSVLNDGDRVAIMTNPMSKPSNEWLDFVKTTQAKNKIKSYFSKQDKERYISHGKELLEKEIRRRKLVISEVLNDNNVKKICNDLKLNNIEDIYQSIGDLRYTASYIINLTKEDKKDVEDILLEKVTSTKDLALENRSDIIVDGTNNIKVNLARCCKPIKGDPIIGYITFGNGITIHNKNCPNIINVSDRLIDVKWNDEISNTYYTDINIEVIEGKNYLIDIISLAATKDIYIEKVYTTNLDLGIIYHLTLKISNINNLDSLISNLNSLKYVKKVERVYL